MAELKELSAIRPENYRFLQEHIRKQSGIVLDESKHYLIEARLLPIALDEGLHNLDELCSRLRQSAATPLQRKVVEAMTTNETYFFREPAHFDALKKTILPALIEKRRESRKLTLWSAAASTGQEAYSIAMTVADMGLAEWDITIVGTDLAENVLDKARAARYTQLEINRGLPATMLIKHFTRQNLLWEVKPAIQKMARFQALDLRNTDASLGQFDVVLCRNVLIYFELETKLQIVQQIRKTINPGGYFFLGSSEVSLSIGPRFSRACTDDATYYRAV